MRDGMYNLMQLTSNIVTSIFFLQRLLFDLFAILLNNSFSNLTNKFFQCISFLEMLCNVLFLFMGLVPWLELLHLIPTSIS
jgi:hypothetical protein